MFDTFEKLKYIRNLLSDTYEMSYVNLEDILYIEIELPFMSIFYEKSDFEIYIGYDTNKESYFVTDLGYVSDFFTNKNIISDKVDKVFNVLEGIDRSGNNALVYFKFNGIGLEPIKYAISKLLTFMFYSSVESALYHCHKDRYKEMGE